MKVAIGPSSFAQNDRTPLELLESAGLAILPNPYGRRLTEPEIIAHLERADALIAGLEPLNEKVLGSASRLTAIARVGIGMDNVDLDAAKRLGIKVSNTPDQPAEAVAELTVAALLSLCRGLGPANDALHEGRWQKTIGRSVGARTLLLVGFGRIGRRVASMLAPFGPRILVVDPALGAGDLPSGIELADDLHDGLSRADVISLHASGSARLLGPDEFARFNPGTILLNAARAGLVDESALIAALRNGQVGAAWFDVFWDEPYTGPLTAFDQVLLTPHVGTYTAECRREMEEAAVRNLLRDLGAEVGRGPAAVDG